MASAEASIRVEVVAARPERQVLVELSVPVGTTAGEAIGQSAIGEQFPELDTARCAIAIWGRLASRADVLKPGDRVEILRPLENDPREARREIASRGGVMGQSSGKPDR